MPCCIPPPAVGTNARAFSTPTPSDPGLDARERPRLAKQGRQILALLQLGPVTTGEMATLTRSHSRRVSDIRAAGHRVEIVHRDHVTGNNTYALVDECPVCDGARRLLSRVSDYRSTFCTTCSGNGWVHRSPACVGGF